MLPIQVSYQLHINFNPMTKTKSSGAMCGFMPQISDLVPLDIIFKMTDLRPKTADGAWGLSFSHRVKIYMAHEKPWWVVLILLQNLKTSMYYFEIFLMTLLLKLISDFRCCCRPKAAASCISSSQLWISLQAVGFFFFSLFTPPIQGGWRFLEY